MRGELTKPVVSASVQGLSSVPVLTSDRPCLVLCSGRPCLVLPIRDLRRAGLRAGFPHPRRRLRLPRQHGVQARQRCGQRRCARVVRTPTCSLPNLLRAAIFCPQHLASVVAGAHGIEAPCACHMCPTNHAPCCAVLCMLIPTGDFLLEPAVVKLFRACGSDLVDKIKFINGEVRAPSRALERHCTSGARLELELTDGESSSTGRSVPARAALLQSTA